MAGKSKDKTTIIKDPLILEWLFKYITFLACTVEDGLPIEMERLRDEMIENLRQWTENIMSEIPVEKYSRKLKICGDNTQTGILLTWSKYGLLYYEPFGNLTMYIGNYWARHASQGYKIEATPFEQEIDKPSDIVERYDIIKQERLKKNIDNIYNMLDSHITKSYVQDTLLGNRTTKLKKPDMIRKKIKMVRKMLEDINCCYNRTEEAKQFVFNKLYNPVAMKAYIEDCVAMTNIFFNTIQNHYQNIIDQEEDRKAHGERYCYPYAIHDPAYKLANRLTGDGSNTPTTTDEAVVLTTKATYYGNSLITPGVRCNMYDYYEGVSDYYSSEEKALFDKYAIVDGRVNGTANANALPDVFKTSILEDLSKMFPELFDVKKSQYYIEIHSPMQKAINEYDKLNTEYEKFIKQFVLRINEGWRYDDNGHGSYRYRNRFILPDEELTKIIFELCTDLDDKQKESLNGFYAYKNNFQTTFQERPIIMDIDWKSMFDCHKSEDDDDETFIAYDRYDHNIPTYRQSNQLEDFWEDVVPKLFKNYVRTGKFNDKYYRSQIEDFIKQKFPDEINDPKGMSYHSMYLIPKNNPYNEKAKQRLFELLDKMENAINIIENGILLSNDAHFLRWCLKEKFIDPDLGSQRIEELENPVPITESV